MDDVATPAPAAAPRAGTAPAGAPSPLMQAAQGALNIFIDLGPVAAFMIAFNVARNGANPDQAIFTATGVFMVATVLALAFAFLVQKRLALMPLVSSGFVLVFGALTLSLNDALFIKVQPTIMNTLYAGIILGSLAVGRNVWKVLFGAAFKLPDRVWRILAVRWACFFIFLAVLNEVIWRAPPDAFWLVWWGLDAQTFWANFKFWGVMPLTLAFMVANVPITLKNLGKTDDGAATPAAAAGQAGFEKGPGSPA